jgi:carboxyl-terminal processing protease
VTPRAYATRVLDLIEHRALYADRVDWAVVRARLLAAADRAVVPAELHEALDVVAKEAGGPHSRLLPPDAVRQLADRSSQFPEARVVNGAGVLVLPACRSDRRCRRAYAAAGGRALRLLQPVRGWVVDLRGNGGGSMWPMLAAAAPLLQGDGVIGAFIDRDGARIPWWLRHGRVGTGWRPQARSKGPSTLPGPAAVLTDGGTASSGEAVAVAFRGLPRVRSYGAATYGFSTANESFPMPDGARLLITGARFADRTGAVYEGPLTPDTKIVEGDALPVALAGLSRH